ncbi:MAG: hypothetical protein IJQ68_08390 [Methanobrevibacter sp.]|uniref:hypothetical protein n=1 Tax=Methanobrevibacter sp. TaxID=66852 RepID=UPI0025F90AFE|nr:hypothetical protein [Methanobrevibacter sp.]MBR0271989.1 hypothetical protein [Methanobrevibacter sp.]
MARRNEGIIAFLMILALVAFVIGSAIGITVSIEKHENETNPQNDTPQIENVTVEMTSNVNNHSDDFNYDYDLDRVDFNENYSVEEYTVNN